GEAWQHVAVTVAGPDETIEQLELLNELRIAVEELLTERQRQVFVAIALNGVPIDVVAERLATTRGAVYKTLHDARQKLRTRFAPSGALGTSAVPAVASY